MPKQPTPKQRQAAEQMSENVRSDNPRTTGEILRGVGYSESASLKPARITQSAGFLMTLKDHGITDDRIAEVMQEGMGAVKNGEADHAIRHKYMETAIKVNGYLKTTDEPPTGDTYNTFVQQNNINPNAVEAKTLVENTLEMLMNQTREE